MKRPGSTPCHRRGCRLADAPALSVIVPTRNEVGNIEPLLARLQDALASIDAEVLVVDDSDDATSQIARQIAARSALPIRVHARAPGQRAGGLGGAVHVGFSEARAPVCVVMDADLQHPPELLKTLLGISEAGANFVIASRYVDGGGDEGLGGWYRHAVSRLATWVAKRVLRPELAGISDPMSGFFLLRRSCLDLPALHPQGFKLLLELARPPPSGNRRGGALHLRSPALGRKTWKRPASRRDSPTCATRGAKGRGASCSAAAAAPASPGGLRGKRRPPVS